jgi:hypothetical protein
LFGGHKIAGIFAGIAAYQRTKPRSAGFQPVVKDSMGLKAPNHPHKLRGAPFLAGHVLIGKIKPKDIDLALSGA